MRARLVNAPPADKTVDFKDLEAGEFLVTQTGNVGVKTERGTILWVVGPGEGRETLKQDISKGKRYIQPVSVVVTV